MSIAVYLQVVQNKIHHVSFELAEKAKTLAMGIGEKAVGIFLGNWQNISQESLVGLPLDEIYVYSSLEVLNLDNTLFGFLDFIEKKKPAVLLLGGTLEGRALAPAIAAFCKTGVTADCTELSFNSEGLLVQTRPAFGGNVMAEILTPIARPQIATVRQGIFKYKPQNYSLGKIVEMPFSFPKSSLICEAIFTEQKKDKSKAEKIIAIGAGFTQKDKIVWFENFCKKVGAELMCSRALVEKGWLTSDYQIGLSGYCVSAKVLITLGISGSVQFMAGIAGVERLIAINTNSDAPLMIKANKAICTDIEALFPFLEEEAFNQIFIKQIGEKS